MLRLAFATLTALLAALTLPAAARAATTMSLGVYLWQDQDHDPIRTQFISIAGTTTETEIDGPEGTKSDSRTTKPDEAALLTTALKEQVAGLTLDDKPMPTGPYITVDWHYSTDTGYADGSTTYLLDAVPASVLALQTKAFGAVFQKPAP